MYSKTALEIRDHLVRMTEWLNSTKTGWHACDVYEYLYECDLDTWVSTFWPGWGVAGWGTYRIAFLTPDKQIIKVNISPGGNEQEISTYQYLLSKYPECIQQQIRPAPTSWELVNGETVVYQQFIMCKTRWLNGSDFSDGAFEEANWLDEITDGLQGGICEKTGIGYIWDLQF